MHDAHRRREGRPRGSHLSWGLAALLVLAAAVPAAAQAPAAPVHGAPDALPGQARAADAPGQVATPPFHSGWRHTLRGVAPEGFNVGSAAAGGGHHLSQDYPEPFPNDEEYREVLARQFNSVTPENQLKWDHLRPDADTFNFGPADEIVEFAEQHGQQVHGHTLFWHAQVPGWVHDLDGDEEALRDVLEEHVRTVVGHYAGRIAQWDVVNEIFDDNAELRMDDNIWLRNLGEEIIADVFHWAHEEAPDALLFVNDYNVEAINAKSTAYYELVQDLLDDGVPVHGFGAQGHLGIQWPPPGTVEENLQRFDDLGLVTAITEADIRMILDEETGEPTEEQLETQAEYYGVLLEGCLAVEGCNTFTVWGFPDVYSWVHHTFAGEGAATIYWDDFTPKPAWYTLRDLLLDEWFPPGRHR
jgi:endo-1,4-beta-xylanase